jgi:hypothetical protein
MFFGLGNELGTSNFDVMNEWMGAAKKHDPRRFYACSTARKVMPNDDYMVTHNFPGIGWVRQRLYNHTNWDYEDRYGKTPIPVVSHEIGQWPVYPPWSEIDKYTGTKKPSNLIAFREAARENGTLDQAADFLAASGALNVLMYKDEIEGFLRTPSCAGFQLLGMQDYSAQGEALVGWLDSFYDGKGILAPETFRRYCGPTVPLLKLPRYIWTDGETLTAESLVHHYGTEPLSDAVVTWRIIEDGAATAAREGALPPTTVEVGTVTGTGTLEVPLDFAQAPKRYTLELAVRGTSLRNQWPFWVFPSSLPDATAENVTITDRWDDAGKQALRDGKRVLLMAHGLGSSGLTNFAGWRPIYWSPSFLPTSYRVIGLLLQDEHPALADFPSGKYTDWHWWNICGGARGYNLSGLPADYRPIAQPVCHFHYSYKLGTIFEVAVGRGKLLVCGYNISPGRAERFPEVRQLRHSLLRYAASDDFTPRQQAEEAFLDKLFAAPPRLVSADPGATDSALLDIQAAAKQDRGGDDVWSPAIDNVRAADGFGYKLRCKGTWKDSKGTYWHGREMKLTIRTPGGFKGDALYVRFRDPENSGREGRVELEKRAVALGTHADALWAKLAIEPGDLADGKLVLKTKVTKGVNLMIDRVVLLPATK